MQTKTFLNTLKVIAMIMAVSWSSISAAHVFAETKPASSSVTTTTTSAKKTTTETSGNEKEKLIDTKKAEETSSTIWSKTKVWFTGLYNTLDMWRASQATIWSALKNEKEAEVAARTQTVDENRDNRVNRILNEEQTTLFNGAGNDLKGDGNIFLLRLYTFALFIFVIIFTTPIIFYGIIILIVIAILNKIIQKIRNPHAY